MFGITINGRFLTRPAPGVNRFATELMRAWLPRYEIGKSIRMRVPGHYESAHLECVGIPVEATGALNGHMWEQLQLPRSCGEDVLLSLCNTGPIARTRQLAVLHDASAMAYPNAYNPAFRNWYRVLFTGLMRRAAVIATVSKFSAQELLRHVGGRTRGIEVIYEGGEHILNAPADDTVFKRLGIENCRYVLAVGSRTPNKNLAGVVKAAELLRDLDVKIVAAGGSNERVFAGVELAADNLVLAGYVSDRELRALYEKAQCFVFPSFYEGFGLPPLEAMHCGCPVVVSRRASMPEICADAAVYCDPSDPTDIARQLRRVLASGALRTELREAGIARAKNFSWAVAAAQLEEILQRNFAGAAA